MLAKTAILQRKHHHRLAALLLCLTLVLAAFAPLAVAEPAEGGRKTVRVGWHEAPYFITDQYERRSGYS